MSLCYKKDDNNYVVTKKSKSFSKLPPGSYIPRYDSQKGTFWFEEFSIKSDSILDLPSSEYTKIVSQMEDFLRPEVKVQYEELGFLYKRSVLLWGKPGTGKTILVNRLANKVISKEGICLFVKNPEILEMTFAFLNQTQPETFVTVIMEELDSIVKNSERFLLTLLDGQVQQNNVMYLITTNYLEKIPKRIYRPGRINVNIEIKEPNAETRRAFLNSKVKDLDDTVVDKTKGLTIDDLKEVVQAVYILKEDLDEVVKRLKANKDDDLKETGHRRGEDYDYPGDDDFENNLLEALVKRKLAPTLKREF